VLLVGAEIVLTRLDRVRESGHSKWIARCPAHDDRSPSLAIRECEDSRILIHCFAGCETEDVLAAIGLTFADVMPESMPQKHDPNGNRLSYKPLRNPFNARQVLSCISHEANVIGLIADKYSRVVDGDDASRLMLAWSRISKAIGSIPPPRNMA
jgi:hypothetical protein